MWGLLGHNISYSLSPHIAKHFWSEQLARGYSNSVPQYNLFNMASDELEYFFKTLNKEQFVGLNVTIPHKQSVIACLESLDDSAIKAGAVNTIVQKNNQLIGFNTDGDGFYNSLSLETRTRLSDFSSTIVVLGYGGSARGIISTLVQKVNSKIIIVGRDQHKFAELKLHIQPFFPNCSLSFCPIDNKPQLETIFNTSVHLLINTIPPQANVSLSISLACKEIIDITYSQKDNWLSQTAKQHGISYQNGIAMLVNQAAIAFHLWFDKTPSSETISSIVLNIS